MKAQTRDVKSAAIAAYGGECACCGEAGYEFLTIDHPKGDGQEHRKAVGNGTAVYWDLKKRGYPAEYRLLCMNCNHSRGMYGYCPHNPEMK